MSILKKSRHEVFARAVACGKTQKDAAIDAAFRYINEVQEDVFVHELCYGEGHTHQEYSLRTKNGFFDITSPCIVFYLPIFFTFHFTDKPKKIICVCIVRHVLESIFTDSRGVGEMAHFD